MSSVTVLTAKQSSGFILSRTEHITTIPVIVMDDISVAEELGRVLVDSGLPVLEVTLRTKNALRIIEKMAKVDGAIIAAGTVLNEQHTVESKSAGAQFIVSPGSTETLVDAASRLAMPLLPGVSTASEMMQLAERGFELLKFFPAEANGGVAALKALSAPFPHLKFCATGGITADNANDYLSLANVPLIGSSWMITEEDIRQRNWEGIAQKAKLMCQ